MPLAFDAGIAQVPPPRHGDRQTLKKIACNRLRAQLEQARKCLGSSVRSSRLAVDTPIMLPILVRSLFRCWRRIACAFGVREMDANLEELQR